MFKKILLGLIILGSFNFCNAMQNKGPMLGYTNLIDDHTHTCGGHFINVVRIKTENYLYYYGDEKSQWPKVDGEGIISSVECFQNLKNGKITCIRNDGYAGYCICQFYILENAWKRETEEPAEKKAPTIDPMKLDERLEKLEKRKPFNI